MKSTDLATWTPVLHFQDILGPVDCPVGTLQRDVCVDSATTGMSNWCSLHNQLGVTENPTCCPPIHDGEPITPGCPDPGAGDDDPSCCGTSSSSTNVPTALLSGLVVGGVLLSRRRRRT
jgi:MYXO-CTERM domain-containing protein